MYYRLGVSCDPILKIEVYGISSSPTKNVNNTLLTVLFYTGIYVNPIKNGSKKKLTSYLNFHWLAFLWSTLKHILFLPCIYLHINRTSFAGVFELFSETDQRDTSNKLFLVNLCWVNYTLTEVINLYLTLSKNNFNCETY